MENVKLKKWKELKSFFDFMPESAELNLVGIEDESIYFHPTYKISEKITIRCQCDIDSNSPYGFELKANKGIKINGYLFRASLRIDKEQIKYVVENYDKIESEIESSLNRQVVLFDLEQRISKFRNELLSNDLFDKLDCIQRNKSKKELERQLEEIQVSLIEQKII